MNFVEMGVDLVSVVKLGEVLEECFGWIEEREGRFVSNVALDCFSGF